MNVNLCHLSQISTHPQNKTQNIGQKCDSNRSSHPLPITSSIPPFAPGNRIRPRYPWHIWRQYPVVVEECYSASTIWLMKVRVFAKPTFFETVLASDFERVVEPQGIKLS